MKRTGKLALAGVLSALSVAVLYLGSLLPGYAIAAAAAAGLIPAAAVLRSGRKSGWAVYAVSSILSLLLLPQKSAAVWYLVVFGHYGMVKSCVERLRSRALEWALKLLLYSVSFGILAFFLKDAFSALSQLIPLGILPLFLIGMAVFVLYDMGFSRLIGLYLRRIDRNLGKEESSSD